MNEQYIRDLFHQLESIIPEFSNAVQTADDQLAIIHKVYIGDLQEHYRTKHQNEEN